MRRKKRLSVEKMGHEIQEAADIAQGWKAFESGQFDLVIACYRKSDFDSITLVKWIRQMGLETPIVLVADSNEFPDAKLALQLGAAGFIARPESTREAVSALGPWIIEPLGAVGGMPPNLDPNFQSISAQAILQMEAAPVDLYIRLSRSRYIRVAHKGRAIAHERLRRYMERGLATLFARKGQAEKENVLSDAFTQGEADEAA